MTNATPKLVTIGENLRIASLRTVLGISVYQILQMEIFNAKVRCNLK
jgi:hypothetical protein